MFVCVRVCMCVCVCVYVCVPLTERKNKMRDFFDSETDTITQMRHISNIFFYNLLGLLLTSGMRIQRELMCQVKISKN